MSNKFFVHRTSESVVQVPNVLGKFENNRISCHGWDFMRFWLFYSPIFLQFSQLWQADNWAHLKANFADTHDIHECFSTKSMKERRHTKSCHFPIDLVGKCSLTKLRYMAILRFSSRGSIKSKKSSLQTSMCKYGLLFTPYNFPR